MPIAISWPPAASSHRASEPPPTDRVRELGGQVEEMEIEGDDEKIARFGRFKLCRDDQGSSFGLHQPSG